MGTLKSSGMAPTCSSALGECGACSTCLRARAARWQEVGRARAGDAQGGATGRAGGDQGGCGRRAGGGREQGASGRGSGTLTLPLGGALGSAAHAFAPNLTTTSTTRMKPGASLRFRPQARACRFGSQSILAIVQAAPLKDAVGRAARRSSCWRGGGGDSLHSDRYFSEVGAVDTRSSTLCARRRMRGAGSRSLDGVASRGSGTVKCPHGRCPCRHRRRWRCWAMRRCMPQVRRWTGDAERRSLLRMLEVRTGRCPR